MNNIWVVTRPEETRFTFAGCIDGPGLDRWLDIRDSEDELQEFLNKCYKYGEKYKSEKIENFQELEK